MGVNLVIIDGDTKIDLTTDTVTVETLKKGETAHNAAGDVITGTLESLDTSDATATAAQILSGKTAYVNGSKITGTMKDWSGRSTLVIGDAHALYQTGKGYHDENEWITVDATNFLPSNIKKDVTILGVTGTLESGTDTSDATATASDIASGKTAYVNGEKITGTLNTDSGYFGEALAMALTKQSVLSGKTALRLSKLPEETTEIGEYVFYGCTGITISEIPASVTVIDNSAFTGCTGITSLTFKGTPTSIASWCFGNNSNLKDIYVPWAEGAVANAPWGASYATIHYNSEV